MTQVWAIDFQTSGVGVDSGTGGEWTGSIASTSVSVTAITKAVNAQITTSSAHGFGVGDHVFFNGVGGMTTINSTQTTYESGTLKYVASVIDSTNFTINWDSSSASTYTSGGTCYMAGATRSNPCRLRVAGHPFAVGDIIYINGIGGATQINATSWLISAVTTNSFTIATVSTGIDYNGTGLGIFTSGGTVTAYRRKVTAITQANPAVFTCKAHAFTNGQKVFIDASAVTGMTELTSQAGIIANATTDTFEISGLDSSAYSAYTDGVFVRRPMATFEYSRLTIPTDAIEVGAEIRVASTTPATQRTTANCTWTVDSNTINTSASLVGTIAVGDLVGRASTGGNGQIERFYQVSAITASSITLRDRYYGTTGTDTASIYHLPRASIANAGGNAQNGFNNSRNYIVKGGYDSTFTTQNGESWFKHSVNDTATTHTGLVTYSGSFDRINNVGYYYGIYLTSSGGEVTNCTTMNASIYPLIIATTTCNIDNVKVGGSISTSYPALYYSTIGGGITFNDVVLWGSGGGTSNSHCVGFAVAEASQDFTGLKCVCADRGFNVAVASVDILNATIDYVLYGFVIAAAGSNVYVNNAVVTNFRTNGQFCNFGTLAFAGTFENCAIANCSIGFGISQSTGLYVKNCSFSGVSYGASLDQYSGSCIFEECDFGNPVNYGVYVASANCKNIKISGCTIDSGQEAKAYNVPISESYGAPSYIIENSFAGQNGEVYPRMSYTNNSTEYYSTGPSLAINITSAINNNPLPIRVVSQWVKAGVGIKFKLKIKRNASVFTGTIVPTFFLNGIEKNTETTITSLTTSWVDYEFDCDSTEIDADGNLELRFKINGTSSVIYVDEFSYEVLP